MQHKCKVTVLRKSLFKDLQEEYLANPVEGSCPFYEEGQEFIFERYAGVDDFWAMGNGTQCSEAWDAISRYIYAALQGGAIMRHWTNDDRIMITCCNDGTRPVVFKIQRMDYKAVYINEKVDDKAKEAIRSELTKLDGVTDVQFRDEKGFLEVFMDFDVADDLIIKAIKSCGQFNVDKIE